MANLELAVKWMEEIAADNSHGYDQTHRNGPNYDCSSFLGTALNKAGFNVNKGSTTRNLEKQLLNCGFEKISVSVARQRGDIFLKVGSHVVMCTDSKNIVHASINEKGTITGGKTGDQTGKEICIRSYYNGNWDYHFRLKGFNPGTNKKVNVFYRVRTKKHGWLPEVKNTEDYAGWQDSPITDVAIRVDKGSIKYRVHVKGGKWLGWITDCNIKDSSKYAGNGKAIDAIQVYYYTPDSIRPYKKAKYKTTYGWQYDTETTGNQDGYAGVFGKNVTKLYIEIV